MANGKTEEQRRVDQQKDQFPKISEKLARLEQAHSDFRVIAEGALNDIAELTAEVQVSIRDLYTAQHLLPVKEVALKRQYLSIVGQNTFICLGALGTSCLGAENAISLLFQSIIDGMGCKTEEVEDSRPSATSFTDNEVKN